MILVGAMAAVLWGIGMLTGAPRRARWVMIGVLLAGVIVVHLVLPGGHPLRMATGGQAAFWLLVVGFGAVIWAYGRGLALLRARATATPPYPMATPVGPVVAASAKTTFSDAELDRYARHMILREVGGPGQKRLKQARVLVIGAGGLGAPALLYLGAAGVGTIGVIDGDLVENANLQRQVIHTDAMIGRPKVESAAHAIAAQNPHVVVRPYHRRFDAAIAADLLADYDIVLDGSDNFDTRYAVNAACVAAGKPLVAAALTQWEGQISVWDPTRGAPCYACVFPEAPDRSLVPSCAEAGVIGPLPGVMGAMMAVETIKLITGAGQPLRGRMLIFDALYAESRVIQLARRADCPVCGAVA